MALPQTNISLKLIAEEYLHSGTDIYFSSFYYGGDYLKANICSSAVRNDVNHSGHSLHFGDIPINPPSTNRPISMGSFRGKAYYYARTDDVVSSGNDVSVSAKTIENESPANRRKLENSAFYTFKTNGNLAATGTDKFACTILDGARPHTTTYIINDHAMYGKGGDGGRGNKNGSNGGKGGTALKIYGNSFLENNGKIYGGGGGGGGGDVKRISYREGYCSRSDTNYSISGSGGGGGAGGGNKGSHGDTAQCNFCGNGGNGSDGNYNDSNAGGNGGSGCGRNRVLGTVCSHEGGDGGDWGAKGKDGKGGGRSGRGGGNSISRNSTKYYKEITAGNKKGSVETF